MNHILDIESLSVSEINNIFSNALQYKKGKVVDLLSNKIIATIFLEPSTRTLFSFQCACYRMNGNIINYEHCTSSSKKGESFEDTIKTISQYVDIIVLRHPEKSKVHYYASKSFVPVINAGDGNGEHPTQALLDVFTMQNYIIFQQPRKIIKIAFVGDLKNGRAVHSTVKLLDRLYDNIEFYFFSNEMCNMETKNIQNPFYIKQELEEEIHQIDILYMTRIQKERNEELSNIQYNNILTRKIMSQAKESMIVLHPLPRNNEIAVDIDDDPRCKFIEQMKNGMYVRMAILEHVNQK